METWWWELVSISKLKDKFFQHGENYKGKDEETFGKVCIQQWVNEWKFQDKLNKLGGS